MRILLAASEAVPFCKTGGLADVVGALAPLFAKAGHEVALFLPNYLAVDKAPFARTPVPGSFQVPVGDHAERASLLKTSLGAVTVYFVDNAKYYSRTDLYRTKDGDFPDNDERFIYFCRAVLEGAKFVDFKPDVIHCHDWQTALIPAYLKTVYATDAFFARAAAVLTVHNFAYQGFYPKDSLFLAGFGWSDFTPDRLEYYGGFNLLKSGLVFAEVVNTVSPTYARETRESPDFGRGMEGVLQARGQDYLGILNGIDVEYWDPAEDAWLPRKYGPGDAAKGKAECKAFLKKALGLKDAGVAPLVGVVSRLDPQKGLDAALEVLGPLLAEGRLQAVVQGAGDRPIEEAFQRLASESPGMLAFNPAYDEGFAHRVYAGSDLFLMPSRFEPCGLGQMIAMRYGSLPVVVRTGGLADTVVDAGRDAAKANGFVAEACETPALRGALDEALEAYADEPVRKRMIKNAMGGDWSWERSMRSYLEQFERALGKVRAA